VAAAHPPTVAVEPLLRSVEWEGVPDPSDPARSAAATLRRPLGAAFATGMGRLLATSRATPDPVALCHAFAHGLVTGAGFSDGRRMTVRLDECAAQVAELYAHPSRNRFRQRLLAHAGPVFDRTGQRDPATLAAIRLYALILAGGQSAEPMRHLAAATVTWGRPARETLTLLQD
jgi:hypothetical protein